MAKVVVPVTLLHSISDMNFAQDCNLVSLFLQKLSKERNIRRKRNVALGIVQSSDRTRIHPSECGCTCGGAKCVGAKSVRETKSFTPDAIMIRCIQDGMTGDGKRVSPLTFP